MNPCVFSETNDDEFVIAVRNLLQTSSDNEKTKQWGGSRPGHRGNIERSSEHAPVRLYEDCFSTDPVYSLETFERRFRITRDIFLEITNRLEMHDTYFTQREDYTGRKGFTGIQKVTAALRMLAYGSDADCLDEFIRMGESTVLECLEHFTEGAVQLYGKEYLRSPTATDLARILRRSESMDFQESWAALIAVNGSGRTAQQRSVDSAKEKKEYPQ